MPDSLVPQRLEDSELEDDDDLVVSSDDESELSDNEYLILAMMRYRDRSKHVKLIIIFIMRHKKIL